MLIRQYLNQFTDSEVIILTPLVVQAVQAFGSDMFSSSETRCKVELPSSIQQQLIEDKSKQNVNTVHNRLFEVKYKNRTLSLHSPKISIHHVSVYDDLEYKYPQLENIDTEGAHLFELRDERGNNGGRLYRLVLEPRDAYALLANTEDFSISSRVLDKIRGLDLYEAKDHDKSVLFFKEYESHFPPDVENAKDIYTERKPGG